MERICRVRIFLFFFSCSGFWFIKTFVRHENLSKPFFGRLDLNQSRKLSVGQTIIFIGRFLTWAYDALPFQLSRLTWALIDFFSEHRSLYRIDTFTSSNKNYYPLVIAWELCSLWQQIYLIKKTKLMSIKNKLIFALNY